MLLRFNEYELDSDLFELRRNGQAQAIEPQVFDLLVYLAQHRERIVGRQELQDNLWAGKIITDSTLSSSIKSARQAIGDHGKTQTCIAP
ncbi:MAG: winged helix-turn-helix domain-containing protein [Gammaproteobacteria bacterium]|nr:winged helix-turn-helix domain-containing protein [Gammaproteobacteria bacterium]